MSTPTHTRKPLTVDREFGLYFPDDRHAAVVVMSCPTVPVDNLPEQRANAARLATCWNAHDELVALVEALLGAAPAAPAPLLARAWVALAALRPHPHPEDPSAHITPQDPPGAVPPL